MLELGLILLPLIVSAIFYFWKFKKKSSSTPTIEPKINFGNRQINIDGDGNTVNQTNITQKKNNSK